MNRTGRARCANVATDAGAKWQRSMVRVALAACVVCIPVACSPPPDTLLIDNVTVIDPASGSVREQQCVLIEGERIIAVSPCNRHPRHANRVSGEGKWLLPGFRDMHVHALWDDSVYPVFFDQFLAYGITGVRDMASAPPVLKDARAYLGRHEVPAPQLLASGPVIDGPEPIMPGHAIAADSAEDARAAVAELLAIDADFAKPYTLLPREAALALLDEAAKAGLPVAGHLPASLTVDDAIAGGMASIEHMAVGIGGLCDPEDEPACLDVFRRLAAANVYLTPTLLIRQRRSELPREDLFAISRIEHMPAVVADDWRQRRAARLQRTDAAGWVAARRQYAREQRITELAIQAGAKLLAGTDAGDLFVPPGLGLHDEIQLLVAAGMTAMQALQAATSNPADFLGLRDEGRVRPGARADLVLLSKNPLEDIRNTREIAAVIVGGNLLDGPALAPLAGPGTAHPPSQRPGQ
jgi:imidazolonepropionase-like amidohydrolase